VGGGGRVVFNSHKALGDGTSRGEKNGVFFHPKKKKMGTKKKGKGGGGMGMHHPGLQEKREYMTYKNRVR